MSRPSRTWLALLLLSACSDASGGIGSWTGALAVEGPWRIPEPIYDAGDTQYVAYEGAGPFIGEEGCSGSLLSGTRLLGNHLKERFPQISLVGGYACRAIRGGSTTMSLHGAGRALDLHIPTDDAAADNDLGDEVGHFLIEHAELFGIQLIIWDEWSWGASRAVGSKGKIYTGVNPHHDHLHVELSQKTANLTSDWFSAALASAPSQDSGNLPIEPQNPMADAGETVPPTADASITSAPIEDGGVIPIPASPESRPVIEPVMEDDPFLDDEQAVQPEPLAPIQGETCAVTMGARNTPSGLPAVMFVLLGLTWVRRRRKVPKPLT